MIPFVLRPWSPACAEEVTQAWLESVLTEFEQKQIPDEGELRGVVVKEFSFSQGKDHHEDFSLEFKTDIVLSIRGLQ